MKGIGTPENRELAFTLYEVFGGRGMSRVAKRLEVRHSLKVSRQTLYEWKEEGGWDERLSSEAARWQRLLTFRERLLLKVFALMERYEAQFVADTRADNQASYAYTNLLRMAVELSRDMNGWEMREKEFLRRGHECEEASASQISPARQASIVQASSALSPRRQPSVNHPSRKALKIKRLRTGRTPLPVFRDIIHVPQLREGK